MPFLCCRTKGKIKLPPEVISNSAEVKELKEQVDEKQREINELFQEKEAFQQKLQNAKAETEVGQIVQRHPIYA